MQEFLLKLLSSVLVSAPTILIVSTLSQFRSHGLVDGRAIYFTVVLTGLFSFAGALIAAMTSREALPFGLKIAAGVTVSAFAFSLLAVLFRTLHFTPHVSIDFLIIGFCNAAISLTAIKLQLPLSATGIVLSVGTAAMFAGFASQAMVLGG